MTPEEGRDVIGDDSEEFEVIENKVEDTSRWSIQYSVVVKRLSDGKFFASGYSVGATEQQDEQPYEYDKFAEFHEVFPTTKTITVYE